MARVLIALWMALALTACAASPTVERHYAPQTEVPYRLDSGDQLRVVVFDQANLTSTYTVDASGNISMPLIGTVAARGRTTRQLEDAVAAALREGYLRDPSVSVQVETYRPFFILGEVGAPGQYAYVADMTAETAVAIAGGFTPRALKSGVEVARRVNGEIVRARVPISFPIAPGDTVRILERWF